jgi:hypothetical protein
MATSTDFNATPGSVTVPVSFVSSPAKTAKTAGISPKNTSDMSPGLSPSPRSPQKRGLLLPFVLLLLALIGWSAAQRGSIETHYSFPERVLRTITGAPLDFSSLKSDLAGPPGPAGLEGEKGEPGEIGIAGESGSGGSTGGSSGSQGATGATGPQGPAGDDGPQGGTGPEGPQGPPGSGGSSDAFVQGGNSFGTAAILGTNDSTDLIFETADTEQMRLTETGNLGIGEAAPSEKLVVMGNAFMGGNSNTLTLSGNSGTVSTIDSAGDVGSYSSIALGLDGFARISYLDLDNGDLKYVQCTNAACSTSNVTTVDSADYVGEATSIAVASDGFARISYYDSSNGALKYAQCTNAACSTSTITTVDANASTDGFGARTAIRLGSDGFARIAYYDDGAGSLKYAVCNNAACSAPTITTINDPSSGRAGKFASLALDASNNPFIAYHRGLGTGGGGRYELVTFVGGGGSCSNTNYACTIFDSNGGWDTSVQIGADGFARIVHSFIDSTNNEATLKFTQCTNTSCSSRNTNTVEFLGTASQFFASMALNSSGFARISYFDTIANQILYLQCTNTSCSTHNDPVRIDSTDNEPYTSIVLTGSNTAILSYYYTDQSQGKDLRVAAVNPGALFNPDGNDLFVADTLGVKADIITEGTITAQGTINTSANYQIQGATVLKALADNVFVGFGAGNSHTSSTGNTALGYQALYSNTSGGNLNTAVGVNALFSNTTGDFNVAVGVRALYSNTTGEKNIALGFDSLYSNTTGSNNIALGIGALTHNTTGTHNIALGENALSGNTTGSLNFAFGPSALSQNTTGSNNIAIGSSALASNFAGESNIAMGFQSLIVNSGSANIALGHQTLRSNTTGNNNIALGGSTLIDNTTGSNNIGLGPLALENNTEGTDNLALGSQTLRLNTTGTHNIGLGNRALSSNSTGIDNIALGHFSLDVSTTGNYNLAFGQSALSANTTGTGNIALGRVALSSNTTGSNNVAIGYNANVGSAALTNATALGYNALVSCSNCLVLGGTGADAVSVGVGTASPGQKLDVQGGDVNVSGVYRKGGTAGLTLLDCATNEFIGNATVSGGIITNGACEADDGVSDSRLKTDVADIRSVLDRIDEVRVVNFDWRQDVSGFDFTDKRQTGVIAQELEQIFPELVSTGADGYKRVSYQALSLYNLQAMKELTQRFASAPTFQNLNVSGEAQITRLVVRDTLVTQTLVVKGHLVGNPDTRGEIVVPAGATSAHYEFNTPYESVPNVVATPVSGFAPSYRVEATKDGFTLYLAEPADTELRFNFQSQQ